MLLRELEIVNFRSIKGRLVAPLDANIVLVHGENGAGKTSLLSATELALTGRVLSLERSDPAYQRQLLHWSAQSGRIDLSTNDKLSFKTDLSADGAKGDMILPDRTASFFTERCYLPQSLLGQLLSIYQTSNEEIDSPLARFVGELLGLDRLDALDVGLKPLADLRNFRKIAEGYSGAEAEKTRLERLLSDHRRSLDTIGKALATALAELAAARSKLDLPVAVSEQSLDQDEVELSSSPDEAILTALADQRRRLDAIRREARQNQTALAQADEANLAESHTQTLRALEAWQRDGEMRLTAASKRAEALLPSANLPAPLEAFNQEASRLLRSEQQQISDRLARATQATERQAAAAGELEVARKQLSTVEDEIGRIAPNSGDLGAILAEISSFIQGDVCPVCDRNFAELNSGSLADHVHIRVRTLSSSAQRLLDLSRTRGQHQSKVETLEREIATLSSRLIDAKQLSELSRSSATLNSVLAELEAHATVAAEGDRLIRAETAARGALADFQSRSLARASLIATLREFALVTGQEEPGATEIAETVIERLSSALEARASLVNQRVAARRAGLEAIRKARAELARRSEIAADVESDNAELKKNTDALARANGIRAAGQAIRSNVERVRVDIIRREFNDRLNKLWRDLFVRLAPNEPFVPAFKIPDASTQRIQPKLITQHRGGGSAGTPGAMLSAGNLNTAALTLFVALHLSVSPQLPWLILDDPVQSMDDVHIANFAALLRTLAKQQRRQVLIAVHDRQLFEYLRLELSPAFPEDSLLALELSRGAHRDSLCIADRRSYQEETAIRHFGEPGNVSKDQYYLHAQMRSGDSQHDWWTEGNWRSLIPTFGEDVALAFRDGAVGFWRQNKPQLRSEGAVANSTPLSTIFGLTGLAIEAREATGWPSGLTPDEAELATRYALQELSGFPAWLPQLHKAFPSQVLDVFLSEIRHELSTETAEGEGHYALYDASWHGDWLWDEIAPVLLPALRAKRANAKNLEYLLAIVNRSSVADKDVAAIASHKANVTRDLIFAPIWFAAWVGADPDAAIPALAARFATMSDPAEQTKLALSFIVALVGGRSQAGRARQAFRTVEHMKSLYLLMTRYIRQQDDIQRAGQGVYSPGLRDDAQDARNALIAFIQETPGKAAFLALLEIARAHPGEESRPWMGYHAKAKAAADADMDAWTPAQVQEFGKSLVATPANHRELWYHIIDKLDALKHDLENGDSSIASILQAVNQETEFRKFIGGWCRDRAASRYVIPQEEELADAKRPDLRFFGVGFDAPVPAELKLADKWTGAHLFERLEIQLCGDYLRDIRSSRGIFLLVYLGSKSHWDLPNGRRVSTFETLIDELQRHWTLISNAYPGVEDIRVIGIDLTRRGVDTKTAKKARKAAGGQAKPADSASGERERPPKIAS